MNNEALVNFVRRYNVLLAIDSDLDLGTVMADYEELQRVFLNLANNAQEAMPEGGELTVSGTRSDETLEVSFADMGSGVPAYIIEKVFDPLFTTEPEGNGLGLAMCQEILNRHDGSISVANGSGEEVGGFSGTLPAITA